MGKFAFKRDAVGMNKLSRKGYIKKRPPGRHVEVLTIVPGKRYVIQVYEGDRFVDEEVIFGAARAAAKTAKEYSRGGPVRWFKDLSI